MVVSYNCHHGSFKLRLCRKIDHCTDLPCTVNIISCGSLEQNSCSGHKGCLLIGSVMSNLCQNISRYDLL